MFKTENEPIRATAIRSVVFDMILHFTSKTILVPGKTVRGQSAG